uniref:Uncharacterized protein n=1 Tax=Megaselia scalaris TaxID=36166 RepID=T1GF01_MEGSC
MANEASVPTIINKSYGSWIESVEKSGFTYNLGVNIKFAKVNKFLEEFLQFRGGSKQDMWDSSKCVQDLITFKEFNAWMGIAKYLVNYLGAHLETRLRVQDMSLDS